MEKIVEDLDILLSRMDIFVSEIKDTASDMAELMNIVGVVPENILQVKDIFKRQCMTIAANASNYKIDILRLRALLKEKDDKTLSFEKPIQNPIVQDPVELQVLTMNELYSLPSTSIMFVDFKGVYPRINYLQASNPDEIRYWYEFGAINLIYLTPPDFPEVSEMPMWLQTGPDFHDEYRYPSYHFIELVIVNDKYNNMDKFRKPFHGFSREGIRVRRSIRLRINLTTMETALKIDFKTYRGESKFSPVMIAPAKKSPSGAIMYLQQRMEMIERGLIKSSPDTQNKFCVQRSHARQGGGICPACSKNKEVTVIPDD
ncbi:hypothetical protein Tco_1359181 [Tanacetum coccineum]